MRRTYRWDPETRKLYEVTPRELFERPQVMPDIAPYKSMITGEMITSRRAHREHLKRHDCQEVGNEMPKPEPFKIDREGIKNDIREAKRQLEWKETPNLQQLREMAPRALKEMGLD